MKALVTGGAGFLGSHMVDGLLAQGREVVVYDHRLSGKCLDEDTLANIDAIEGDIRDAEGLEAAAKGCDVIYHCAAMVGVAAYSSYPARTMETEVDGLRNVCCAALAGEGSKVIYASSSAVYGHAGGTVPLIEATDVAPVSSYAVAKRFNELYLDAQFAEHGLESVSLRIFNIYGPRQDERLVIPRFIHRATAGEPLEIYGDGSQTRDFVYVGDVVRVALACAERADGCEIINACSGRECSIWSLAEATIRLSGSGSEIKSLEQPKARRVFEVERSFGSRDKLEAVAGNFPCTSLEEGLKKTIASIVADD